ncbi:MAG: hypothetical protein M1409_07760 [Actinobacteria bacterium]|nr:hypothetical protein [Actinomycetota bacterium]
MIHHHRDALLLYKINIDFVKAILVGDLLKYFKKNWEYYVGTGISSKYALQA